MREKVKKKPHVFKVGKGLNYTSYLHAVLATMYDAGVVYFSMAEMSEWAGLPVTHAMRNFCDGLVLRGWLAVEPVELQIGKQVRIYKFNAIVWDESLRV